MQTEKLCLHAGWPSLDHHKHGIEAMVGTADVKEEGALNET